MFLHSLFDGHPEVLSYPAVHGIYSPFFRPEYLRTVDDAIEYLGLLTRVHIHLEGRYDEAIGKLDAPQGNFHLERERFLPLLRDELSRFELPLQRRQLVESLHRAYGRYAGQDLSRSRLLIEHVHSPSELGNALADFPDAWCVHTIREPCDGYYGMIDLCTRAYGHFKSEFFFKFTKNVFVEPWLGLGSGIWPGPEDQYRLLRIEDLNARGDSAVRELCDWLGIADHEALRSSTVGGYRCHGNSGKLTSITTFKSASAGTRHSRIDTLRIESLLRRPMRSQRYAPRSQDTRWNRILGALAILVPLRTEFRWRPLAIGRDVRTDARNFPLARILLFQARHRHPRLFRVLRRAGFAEQRTIAHRALSAAMVATLTVKRAAFDPWYFYLRRVALLTAYHRRSTR